MADRYGLAFEDEEVNFKLKTPCSRWYNILLYSTP
jgi:hypothetical protein